MHLEFLLNLEFLVYLEFLEHLVQQMHHLNLEFLVYLEHRQYQYNQHFLEVPEHLEVMEMPVLLQE
jgi:hypothetical protein